MGLFSDRSQKTSKCGKNINDTLSCALCATLLSYHNFTSSVIYYWPGPGCSKLGKGNPGLMWHLIAGLKALRENSVQIFLLAILSLDVLKRIVKIFPKILLNKEIKKPELKFNPGLKLIGLRTTGPRCMATWNPFVKLSAQYKCYFSNYKRKIFKKMIDPCKVPWGNMLFSSPIAIQNMDEISKN